MIEGWDGGYGLNKTSSGVIFPSKLQSDVIALEDKKNCLAVSYNNRNYIVGRGSYETDTNKIQKESTRIFMLTALALSTRDDVADFKVVTGLPIKQYKGFKDELKNALMTNRVEKIEVDGSTKTIIIDDVHIYPQCLGAYYSLSEDDLYEYEDMDIVLVDIGTRTVDIALLEKNNQGLREVNKYSTILEGTLTLYNDIVHAINSEFDLDLKVEDGEKILKRGLYLYGEKQDLSFAKNVIAQHIAEIFKELDLNYPVKTEQVLLAGGGAYLYGALFNRKYKHAATIENAQFANALGFKKVGETIWRKY
jgi:plasmid segregation protein ParM